jgi:hypothetical protein
MAAIDSTSKPVRSVCAPKPAAACASMRRLQTQPDSSASTRNPSGTAASAGPPMAAMNIANSSAKGASNMANSTIAVAKPRTWSMLRRCDDNCPLPGGSASRRAVSRRANIDCARAWSTPVCSRSSSSDRTWRTTSSNTVASTAPTVSTTSVAEPCDGITRS